MTDKARPASPAETKTSLRTGLFRSFASLLIKIATAGLTYVMFVVLSRLMGVSAYGEFAFGLALATILSIGASIGQQTAILRFWPEDEVNGDDEGARNALQSGWALTLIAGTGLTLALALFGLVYGTLGAGFAAGLGFAAAALLILPMGAAEYASSALRAQGSVILALVPRDIFWRLFVPLAAIGLFVLGIRLSGPGALALTGAILAFALFVQAGFAKRRGYFNRIGFSGLKRYWRKRGDKSVWFLISAAIDSMTLNLDVVLVGLLLNPSSAGLYFNAFRTAGLLTLFMFALELVTAPIIARHFHGGEKGKVQTIVTLSAWGGFAFSVVVFLLYVFFGDFILSLFGEHYAEGQTVLLLLSVGLLADAASGPTRILMMMTGHERTYAKIIGAISVVGVVIQLALIPVFGVVGAAAANAITRILAQAAIAWWTWRNVGIGATIFGTFLPRWGSSKPPLPASES